jgi:hypothetical protein
MKIERLVSSGMLRRVALVRTDVSEKLSASFIRVTRIGELGTTVAATINRSTLRRNTSQKTLFFLVTAVKTSLHNYEDNLLQLVEKMPEHKIICRYLNRTFDIMKNAVLWDVTPCAASKYRRLRES